MTIEWIEDTDAEALLNEPAFRAGWERLWTECYWASSFQSLAYVERWYRSYQSRFAPLLLLCRDQAGNVEGLLCLAAERSSGHLVAAGAEQAEYQGWITRPALSDKFAVDALAALGPRLNGHTLRLRCLPPSTPLDWFDRAASQSRLALTAHRRPLLNLNNDNEITGRLNKSGNKSRLKRLEKLGALDFRYVTEPDELSDLFRQGTTLSDARHLALHGVAPFADDPMMQNFGEELLSAKELLHATALRVGDRLAAVHFGARTRNELQLGLIAHNPWLGRFSPGKFHILLLAKLLREQGFRTLDLTTGGDQYKERFANAWDEVHSLTVYPSARERWKHAAVSGVRVASKRLLERAGVSPAQLRDLIAQIHSRSLRNSFQFRAPEKAAKSEISQRFFVFLPSDSAQLKPSATVYLDRLDHLFKHPHGQGPLRKQFMADAIARCESGQHVYTQMINGDLAYYGWLASEPPAAGSAELWPGVPWPKETAVIQDLRSTMPLRNSNGPLPVLETMLRDAAKIPGIKRILVIPSQKEEASQLLVQAYAEESHRPQVPLPSDHLIESRDAQATVNLENSTRE